MTVTPSAGIDRPSPRDIRRVVWSSFLGTALEWYDFFLFGTTAAIVFAPLFFPQGNPTAMTLQSFLVFAVGFVARPIGAVVFGHFGDKLGRKGTLITTLMIMGGATTLMGVLPEYHQAGIIAPVLLTVLRFTQGLATGGEWGGATLMALEFAPEEKRGMYASVVQMGSPVGNLLSTGAVTLFMVLAGDDFLAWGWRIPYLLSIVLIGVGLWMRVGLKESPEFEKIVEAHEVDKVPFFDLMGNAWQRVIVATMCYLFGIAGFFMMGLPRLRELIVEVMRLEGIEADPDDIIVTAGSQLALEVLSKVMLDPGDVVIAEGPSYAGGLAVLATYEADLRRTEIDEHGLVPERLAEQIATVEAECKRVKMVYSIPTFQNPANTVLPPERREALVRLCDEHGILLIEDNAYGLLGFDGETVRAMKADHPQVAYLGSFSRMFGPGLRLGWILPPRELRPILVDTVETVMLNPPTMGQVQMAAYLDGFDWQGKLAEMRALYERRCDALVAALEASMPDGVTWQRPRGSFYLWVRLPEGIDSDELLDAAIARGVVFVPGTAFYVDGQGNDTMRLSYCLPTEEQLTGAGIVLGELVTEMASRSR